jgi:hypothetical protein
MRVKTSMSCSYIIEKQKRLVISTGWDHVTFAEAKAHQDQLKNDPDFVTEYNQLLDATAITVLAITIEQAKILASGSDFFSSTSRRAWVASKPVIFGLARLMEGYRKVLFARGEFCVFYERELAMKWLGLNNSGH